MVQQQKVSFLLFCSFVAITDYRFFDPQSQWMVIKYIGYRLPFFSWACGCHFYFGVFFRNFVRCVCVLSFCHRTIFSCHFPYTFSYYRSTTSLSHVYYIWMLMLLCVELLVLSICCHKKLKQHNSIFSWLEGGWMDGDLHKHTHWHKCPLFRHSSTTVNAVWRWRQTTSSFLKDSKIFLVNRPLNLK